MYQMTATEIRPLYTLTSDMIREFPDHADAVREVIEAIVQDRPTSALAVACRLADATARENDYVLTSNVWRLVGMLQMHAVSREEAWKAARESA